MKVLARFALFATVLVTALLLSAASAAQSPFDGTWRILIDQSRFSPKPMVTFLSEGWFHCQSCNPQLDFRADGTDQPVIGQAYDTISVREVDPKKIRITIKKAGNVILDETQTASVDGNKLTIETMVYPANRGPAVTAETTATRIGIAPSRINRISGQWRLTRMKESENGLLVTYKSNGDQLGMTQPTGESYTANLDGKDYPAKGAFGYNAVSLRRIDENTFEETDKRDGAVVNIIKITVSPDGKKMTIDYLYRINGRITTYIAVKQ